MKNSIADGESITRDGKTYVSDDGELVEIAGSYPDVKSGLAALRKDV